MSGASSPSYLPLGPHAFWYRPGALEPDATSVDPTLIVLFGWMSAQRSHLLKYTEMYKQLYPRATIIVVRSHLSFLWASHAAVATRFRPVVEVLEALGCLEGRQRILTHSFSNGGSFHVLAFRRLLKGKVINTTTPRPPSALVIDSSPGGDRIHLLVRALISPIRNSTFRFVSRIVSTVFFSTLYLVHGILLWRTNPVMRMINALEQPNLLPWLDSRTPRLYLYSKKDEMVPWRDIEEHVGKCEKAGLDVRKVRFEESGHVAHARMHPEEYWDAVKKLWEDACRA